MRAFVTFFFVFASFGFPSKCQEHIGSKPNSIQSYVFAPGYFIPNTRNQKTGKSLVENDEAVAFVQTPNGRIIFTPSGAYVSVSNRSEDFKKSGLEHFEPQISRIKREKDATNKTIVFKAGISKAEANKRGISPRLEELTHGIVNFMIGHEVNWQTKVPTYRKLVYGEVWEGIDLEYLCFFDHLEFCLKIEPGSDPDQILMETGANKLSVLEDGRLVASLAGAELVFNTPKAFQDIQGESREIPVQYQIVKGNKLSFQVGNYSKDSLLLIRPTLTWSSFLGSNGEERGNAISVDSLGNLYITGYANTADYPTTEGVYDELFNGLEDVIVSKLSNEGNSLLYSTFIGGIGTEEGRGIAVDNSGNAFVTGYTYSNGFPITSGVLDGYFNGNFDAFVIKLSSDGSDLVYSTFLGSESRGFGISVDIDGNAFVTGFTASSDFPTTNDAYDELYNGEYDVFVSKLSSDGSGLIFSTFIGGSGYDTAFGIEIDTTGNAYVAGNTNSSGFPTTNGAFDESHNGNYDAFACVISSSGRNLLYSTLLGGSSYDSCTGIAVDTSSNAFVTGVTQSSEYPTTSGVYDETQNGNGDVFVTKLTSDGSDLLFSTFLGAMENDIGSGITIDTLGNACVTGWTNSNGYPTTIASLDETYNGNWDAFVSKISSDGRGLIYSTFLGGTGNEEGKAITLDSHGDAIVTGRTNSSEFPNSTGAFDQTHNGLWDAFITKIWFYQDFNFDGCSNEDDFFDMLPYWSHTVVQNHIITVMDFFRVNLEGPVPCP